MKTQIFTLVLLFFSSLLYSQDITFDSINSIEAKRNYRIINNSVWLRDSVHYFAPLDNGWKLTKRELVTSRDDKNRLRSSIVLRVDSSGKNEYSFLTTVNYYSNDILKDSLVMAWDNNSNSWADTFYYLKKDINGNVLKKIQTFLSIELTSYKNKDIYRYDTNSNNIYHLFEIKKDQNNWLKRYETFYFYDNNNLLIEKINHTFDYLDYDVHNYENFTHYIYGYDNLGNKLFLTKQEKKAENDNWLNTEKFLYYYDNNNLLINEIRKTWDKEINKWTDNFHGTYFYEDTVMIKEFWKHWEKDSFRIWSQTFYEYNNADKVIHELIQSWHPEKQKWNNSLEYFFDYNQKGERILYIIIRQSKKERKFLTEYFSIPNSIQFTYFIGDKDNNWVNRQRIINYLSDDNMPMERHNYFWNIEENKWKEDSNIFYYYDDFGNLAEKITTYFKTDSSVKSKSKIVYFWSKYEISKTDNLTVNDLNIYPNPAKKYIEIKNLDASSNIYIYSLNGKLVKTIKEHNQTNIDISNLKPGIYFLKTENNQNVYKFIVVE